MANMQELLAKLRAKTDNPSTPSAQINEGAGIIAQAKKETESIPASVVQKASVLANKSTKLGHEFQEKMIQLEDMLLEKHPRMPNLLREIHVALKQQPENVLLLDEVELNILVQGLDRQTGSELAQMMVAKAKKPGASKVKVSASDLGF